MKLLQDVLSNYKDTKVLNNGKSKDIGSISQEALTKRLPELFSKIIQNSEFPIGRYKFKGSYGQINFSMPDIPWVAAFDTRVTTSAQRGFDIVLLFSREMKSCVLSLNQGYTAYKDEFKSEDLVLKKLKQTAERARANLSPIAGASYGPIDLGAITPMSKGYELGAIANYVYEADSLPSESQFAKDFESLLFAYDQLFNLAGKDLLTLQALTDSEFQSEIEESLALKDVESVAEDIQGPELKPTLLHASVGAKYKRDVAKSKRAIKRSGYSCEVDDLHISFISNVTKKKYVEAHHLVPMSFQSRYENSLDVCPNIVSLCPNCHRLLHHGVYTDKVDLLKSLFSKRHQELFSKGIDVTLEDVLAIYKGRVEETD